MKTSLLTKAVPASGILLSSALLSKAAMADPCPMPSFAAARTFETGPGPQSVAVSDFNGDGKPDLAVANEGCGDCGPQSRQVSVLLGNGDGSFQAAINYHLGKSPVSVAVRDFNGDGEPDLAVAELGLAGVQARCPCWCVERDGDYQRFLLT